LVLEPLHRAFGGHGFSENCLFAARQATHMRTLATGTRAEGRISVRLTRDYCQANTVVSNSYSGVLNGSQNSVTERGTEVAIVVGAAGMVITDRG
jgi:hypothetical protein